MRLSQSGPDVGHIKASHQRGVMTITISVIRKYHRRKEIKVTPLPREKIRILLNIISKIKSTTPSIPLKKKIAIKRISA